MSSPPSPHPPPSDFQVPPPLADGQRPRTHDHLPTTLSLLSPAAKPISETNSMGLARLLQGCDMFLDSFLPTSEVSPITFPCPTPPTCTGNHCVSQPSPSLLDLWLLAREPEVPSQSLHCHTLKGTPTLPRWVFPTSLHPNI